jgi:hypothetical protein
MIVEDWRAPLTLLVIPTMSETVSELVIRLRCVDSKIASNEYISSLFQKSADKIIEQLNKIEKLEQEIHHWQERITRTCGKVSSGIDALPDDADQYAAIDAIYHPILALAEEVQAALIANSLKKES